VPPTGRERKASRLRAASASIGLLLVLAGCSSGAGGSSDLCLQARTGISYVNSVVQGAHDGTMSSTAAASALKSASDAFGAAIAAAKKGDPNLADLQAAQVVTAKLRADLVSGDSAATTADLPAMTAALNPLTTRCP
jgi:hypothetical protein